jgi:hypothetical protein
MSDELRKLAEENCILKMRSGSHLYGTNTPQSDEDFVGIFLPPVDYILGLKTVEQVDFSTKDKDESGKNTADAIDFTLYEIRKFVRLALQNNPNILEILFVNDENIIHETSVGKLLRAHRKAFLHKGIKDRFVGYALAQRHKMVIKKDHFQELLEGYQVLGNFNPKIVMGQVYDELEYRSDTNIFQKKGTGVHIHCGDICFEPGVYVKKALGILKERIDRVTNRSDLMLKYGYDVKFASHLIRLLREGIDLLKDGDLSFPLKDVDLLLAIRRGEWKMEDVIKYADELEDEIRAALAESKLPAHPDYQGIESLVIDILGRHLQKNHVLT